jgi:hypothetical protein
MPSFVTRDRTFGVTRARGRRLIIALVTLSLAVGAGLTASGVLAEDTPHSPGAISQLDGMGGCLQAYNAGGCDSARGIYDFRHMAMSPNGRFIFTAGEHVSTFMRDPITGRLSQASGIAGCVSDDGDDGQGGPCLDPGAERFGSPKDVAVSPDGKNVYIAVGDGVGIFKVDPDLGSLTQLPGSDGCVSGDSTNAVCPRGRAMETVSSVTVSPDGLNVYLTGQTTSSGTNPGFPQPPASGAAEVNAVVVFSRNPDTGALTQLSADAGCIRDAANDPINANGCHAGSQMYETTKVTISPDNKYAYVAVSEATPNGPGAVVVMSRQTGTGDVTTDGRLTQVDCVGEATTGCATLGKGFWDANLILATPDNKYVYLTSGGNTTTTGTLSSFSRDPDTGQLTQLQCLSRFGENGNGVPGVCDQARGLGEPSGLAMTRDPTMLYVASGDSYGQSAVAGGPALFSRDLATGLLTQLPGTDGCLNDNGTDGCGQARWVRETSQIVAAPGCDYVYTAGHGGNEFTMGVFQRNTDCTPISNAAVGPCSTTGDIPVSVKDTSGGTGPKKFHYTVDGGAEQVVTTTAGVTGTATITIPQGKHVLEYWGEDQDKVLEKPAPLKPYPPHHVDVLVDSTKPTVTITSDQKKTTYTKGEMATITVAAADAGGLTADPSADKQAIPTNVLGKKTITKTATDTCGNATTASFVYTVVAAKVKTLRLSAKPARAQVGKPTKFTFKVTSGGKAVAGATVSFNGMRLVTNRKGQASTTTTLRRKGTVRAKATKPGYKASTKKISAR